MRIAIIAHANRRGESLRFMKGLISAYEKNFVEDEIHLRWV